jgi:hypothetical protein
MPEPEPPAPGTAALGAIALVDEGAADVTGGIETALRSTPHDHIPARAPTDTMTIDSLGFMNADGT